ncbi:MAG: O-antigen ligase family protein [Anaeromyxobacter sp.]|nr:O-antigen ligase family protein [Anaeromyxobacter sp.]
MLLLPLARGGVDAPVELAAACLAVLAALMAAPAGGAVGLAGLALLVVLAATALQLLPLPAWLHVVSPSARDLFSGALAPLGLYPAARPLSLDPAATGRMLAASAGGLAAFWAAWALGETHRRRALLVRALGSSGLLVALVALGQALLGFGTLLSPAAPFVNPNHLAGHLGLTSFVLLGLALKARGQARLLWLMAFALTGAVVFLSLSRGGIAAFLGGAVLFAALAAWRRRPEGSGAAPPRGRWALLGGLAAALSVAAYLALDPVLAELGTVGRAGEETKLALWRPALQLVRDYPLTGIGRGAFGTVYPAYKTEPELVTFTHLENEWLQAPVELGLPVGLLLVGALAATWLAAARRRDLSYGDVGLLAGTATLAAQNLVDFSLELSGVALPFLVALGLAARGAGAVAARPALVRGGLVVAGLLGALGAAVWARQPAADAPVLEQVAWRPADYLPQAVEGVRLVRADRCAEALPWLSRAMLLGPTAPEPHLYAARCLAAAGQDVVARREYRLAMAFGSREALPEAATRYRSVEALLEVAPDSADGLLQLGYLLARDRPADAARVYRRALEEQLDDRALVPLARATLAAGDRDEALRLARRRAAEAPTDPEGWLISAWILVQAGQEAEGVAVLERGLLAIPGAPPLVTLLAERSLLARRFGEARRIAEQMSARTPRELAARHQLVARALAGQGRVAEAIEQARSAAAALPDDPGALLAVASYCEQAGRLDDAIAAVERAATLGGAPEALAARLEGLRKARQAQRDRRMGESLLRP